MLIKTEAIVLSKVKYRDHDLIVKCYTSQRGLVSYLLRGVLKSTKGGSKSAYFQSLSQLQLEENFKPNRSLQYINEVKMEVVYQSLHTHIHKSAIVMFLAEVLASVLKEEEQNTPLYDYLKTSLNWFDNDDKIANFHLLFLLQLTKYLGFFPEVSTMVLPYFNLSTGTFETKDHPLYTISGDNLTLLKQLLGMNFDALHEVKLNSKQRQSFLTMLLLYFELHLVDFRKPKSLDLFSGILN